MSNNLLSQDNLEFVIFCIENLAVRLGVDGKKVYRALTEKSDILESYIVPCSEILSTQSKEYIIDDIINVMKEKGVTISQ